MIVAEQHRGAGVQRVRCLAPFYWMEINGGGRVTPCCSSWFKGTLGNATEQPLEEIWNGEDYRKLRESMFEGNTGFEEYCNVQTCPTLLSNQWSTLESGGVHGLTDDLLKEIREGHLRLDIGPRQLGLANDPRCNLRCIMCDVIHDPRRDGASIKQTLKTIEPLLSSLHRVRLLGSGEALFVPELREFLFNFPQEKYPDLTFQLLSHGNYLNPENWKRIEHLNIDILNISIDAASKKTYEKIRVGGHWENLERNVPFLAEKQGTGKFNKLFINMTVNRINFHEMAAFARLGRQWGVGLTYFAPVFSMDADVNLFDPPQFEPLCTIAEQLRDPVMSEPNVDPGDLWRWKDYDLLTQPPLDAAAAESVKQIPSWLRPASYSNPFLHSYAVGA